MNKKYLMKGLAALALAFVAVSCSNDEDVFDPNASKDTAKYQATFVKTFGEPAANHTWGFGEYKPVRGWADHNENMWADFYFVPEPLTSDQINATIVWFAQNKNPEGVAIDYKNFFYQNVGSTANSTWMNQFLCGGDETLYNLNFGNQDNCESVHYDYDDNIDADINDRKLYRADRIGVMLEGSTEYFGYKNSHDGDAIYRDYVIIPGERIDASLEGRYFVGLDYHDEWNPESGNIALDGYYNDWIICITPGFLKGQHRIIAEDFSAEEDGDFDFNDVVFDVTFLSDTKARINLLAAGGTLPLYIGETEVHEAFGVRVSDMVNTGKMEKDYVEFEMECNHGWNPNNIPVYVKKGGNLVELTAELGKAPAKICVKNFYKWCTERESIHTKYSRFSSYVKDQNVKWY